jgi:acetyltransferase-like isoleucine patch superfamily enzyme
MLKYRADIMKLRGICNNAGSNLIMVLLRAFRYRLLYNKKILAHKMVVIKGINNITSNNTLTIGLGTAGFVHNYDATYLNIKGKLSFGGNYTIGRGTRMDIAKGAVVTIGTGGYINVNNTFIIKHKLVIGDGCVIAWDCQFLDEDFHELEYQGKIDRKSEIVLGNNIWVGCGVQVYKGTVIPDGCVIAAGAVVRGIIEEKNVLVAGNPGKIIKRNISWH